MTDDELKLLFAMLRQEVRSDFRDQVGATIEHVDQRFDLLAESIATLDEKFDRARRASSRSGWNADSPTLRR